MQTQRDGQSRRACTKGPDRLFGFIGRTPVTEMERSGIEVALRSKLEEKGKSRRACTKGPDRLFGFIGRTPVTEKERSGIEVALRKGLFVRDN